MTEGRKYRIIGEEFNSRFRINFVQEAASVVFRKHTSETPWLFFERLYVLYLKNEHVARLCGLDIEWAGQIVDFSEVDVAHVVGGVVVANLAAGPVYAFDLHDFVVLDGAD